MSGPASIVWFRRDLRLVDQPALYAAAASNGPVVPVYIASDDPHRGAASRWWLHHSLKALDESLRARGSRLIIRAGEPAGELKRVAEATGAQSVFWNRCYDPVGIRREEHVKALLHGSGVRTSTYNASLLFEPWTISTQQDGPYKVFTPFWKRCLQEQEPPAPSAPPNALPPPVGWPDSLQLEDLELLPRIDWAAQMRDAWSPGEDGAYRQLERFLEESLRTYPVDRDRPDRTGTSRLSPHLHFGEISPRTIWHAVKEQAEAGSQKGLFKGAEVYLREVGWREFAHHLLYHFPETIDAPLRPEFADFPWRADAGALKAWGEGRTGYPIVDAGMRELWAIGWMHNRVRMIAASFLVKDLLLPWQKGAAWFMDTLVDADLANNTLGWQWTAGCGADAAPYFRIFNPVLQGKKFDPDGAYVRRWVPELAGLDAKWIHAPWKAPKEVLIEADVSLGESYPRPIVDHGDARDRALEAYNAIRKG